MSARCPRPAPAWHRQDGAYVCCRRCAQRASLPGTHRLEDKHGPLASLGPYSDSVANAFMLHKISLDQNCWPTVMTITGGSIARELRAKSDLPVIFLTSKAEMIDEVSHRWLSFLKQSVIQLGRFLQQLRHLGYPRRNSPPSSRCSDGFRCEPVIQKALFAASLRTSHAALKERLNHW
jgi:CheY-like chemotaxis protein